MADIVVIGGQQYDRDNLPEGLDAAAAVPLDEWRRSQAKGVAAAPVAPTKKRAKKKPAADTAAE